MKVQAARASCGIDHDERRYRIGKGETTERPYVEVRMVAAEVADEQHEDPGVLHTLAQEAERVRSVSRASIVFQTQAQRVSNRRP